MMRIKKERVSLSGVRSTLKNPRNRYKLLLPQLALASLFVVNPLWSGDVKYREVKTLELQKAFGTKQPWKVTVYEDARAAKDVFDIVASSANWPHALKLCFWHDVKAKLHQCVGLQSRHKETYRRIIQVKKLSLEQITSVPGPKYAVVLVGETPHPSDSLFHVSVWTYSSRTEKFANILAPAIEFTDDGELKFFPDLEGKGIAVGARSDHDYKNGETHLSNHRHEITVYRYLNKRYHRLGVFQTTKKYPGGEGGDDEMGQVIQSELSRIKTFVREKTLVNTQPTRR